MTTVSQILFIISNGLLIPVVLLLLILLVKALMITACFYREYIQQRKISSGLQQIVENYNPERVADLENEYVDTYHSPVTTCLCTMLSHKEDREYCELSLADFQIDVQKELSGNRLLIKFGPMLGLMGTLIPMGPALVGLATGDIASMAYNMQVAFATTVVGMLVAGIGLATLQVKQRYYARSFNALEFIFHKLTNQ